MVSTDALKPTMQDPMIACTKTKMHKQPKRSTNVMANEEHKQRM